MSLLPVGIGASGDDDFTINDSLRLRSSASAYLSRTPTSTSDRTEWTWSAWVKHSDLATSFSLFSADHAGGSNAYLSLLINNSDEFQIFEYTGSAYTLRLATNAKLRDPSAWYHLVCAVDTDQGTSTNRIKLYVNGVQQTSLRLSTYPSSGHTTYVNTSGNLHAVGATVGATTSPERYLDGYLTEVNFIDGQQLTPEDFGEYDDNGTWKAKRYTGTYGTNGFYLPMKPTTQADGFNTVLYTGTGASQSINGVGFSPDLVWIKTRSSGVGATNHFLFDSVRGATKHLFSNSTAAEATDSTELTSFDTDGFSVGSDISVNSSGESIVAWSWDAGSGSPVSNTVGTIPSTVKANTTSGFSIVSYEGTGGATDTIGHGLSSTPEMVIVKDRDAGNFWSVYHVGVDATAPEDYLMRLNTTNARLNGSVYWNDTAPTSSVFTVGTSSALNAAHSYIAYCFHSVAGYSKLGSYTGNGSTNGPTITTGFRPGFVMVKETTTTSSWTILDSTRDPNNTADLRLFPDLTNAESSNPTIDFLDTGFQLKTSNANENQSGSNFIYMAFADTADARFNFDASGNKNNFDANNINSNGESETTYDLMKDTPSLVDENAANFCTMNALNGIGTISDGNMTLLSTVANWQSRGGTVAVSSGKWYWEAHVITRGTYMQIGIVGSDVFFQSTDDIQEWPTGYGYYSVGKKVHNAANSSYGTTFTTGDLIGVALDLDAGTIEFYKNNVSQGVAFTGISGEFIPAFAVYGGSSKVTANFGQRPFKYTPPSGFLKLNTFNLPDSTIEKGSDYFNTVLYSGNSSTQSITGVGFQPDWLWLKSRSNAASHGLFDVLRVISGAEAILSSNTTAAENTGGAYISSFDTDGFTLNGNTSGNGSGHTYVGWNWKANGSGVLNEVGDIDSTVSANTTAGFSIVTYTGTGSASTVGHGLGVAPSMIIAKQRNVTDHWVIYHKDTGKDKVMLFTTSAAISSANYWGTGGVTSTVFGTKGSSAANGVGSIVAYCFAEVAGYSAFGSYIGNGSSTDGPFIYTGFRPAWILVKVAANQINAASWQIYDTTRNTFNVIPTYLFADSSGAESDTASTYFSADILSNGFKLRAANTYGINQSGATYIYMAFAENPFKNALAR